MTELELLLAALGVLLLWNLVLCGSCDCQQSTLEEYRFGYKFYLKQYDLLAGKVYSDQEREAVHEEFVEGFREHMTWAGYPPIERRG